MELDASKLLENAIRDGIREGVKNQLSRDYDNPLKKLIESTLAARGGEFRALLDESLQSCMGDVEFRETIKTAVRGQLAKTLIQRFGGEMEKQVNVLKSDPATRARITLAIEEIVKEKSESSLQTA
jgi:predicted transcriptional regulator